MIFLKDNHTVVVDNTKNYYKVIKIVINSNKI